MPPEKIDSLDAKSLKGLVLSLVARIDELVAKINELHQQNSTLFEQNKALLERIAELEGRGGGKPCRPDPRSALASSGLSPICMAARW